MKNTIDTIETATPDNSSTPRNDRRRVDTVGIVGAGVMGRGLTHVFAQSGFSVVLLDVSESLLAGAMTDIAQTLRLYRLFGKEKGVNQEEALARIKTSTNLSDLENVELVIENVTEKQTIKRNVYEEIDSICQPYCIFAANTSAIPITRIASWTRRADRIIGTHFMNPAPLKKTVEVIRGYHTTDGTLEITRDLLARAGKDCVVVNDAPGFVSNRVLMMTINEAILLLGEGVANAADVDRIFKTCFGHPMGPLETADLIGLDTILNSIEVLQEMFSDSKYRPAPMLKKMVDAGLFGRKCGRGFYSY